MKALSDFTQELFIQGLLSISPTYKCTHKLFGQDDYYFNFKIFLVQLLDDNLIFLLEHTVYFNFLQ